MTAFQPSLPLSSQRSTHPSRTRATSPISATAALPRTAAIQLQAYEDFLRSSPRSEVADAPVFQTAEGALVCEWHAPNSSPDASPNTPSAPANRQPAMSALLKLAEYEKFLATSQAAGVDMTRPVYVNHEGNLVCHYP